MRMLCIGHVVHSSCVFFIPLCCVCSAECPGPEYHRHQPGRILPSRGLQACLCECLHGRIHKLTCRLAACMRSYKSQHFKSSSHACATSASQCVVFVACPGVHGKLWLKMPACLTYVSVPAYSCLQTSAFGPQFDQEGNVTDPVSVPLMYTGTRTRTHYTHTPARRKTRTDTHSYTPTHRHATGCSARTSSSASV